MTGPALYRDDDAAALRRRIEALERQVRELALRAPLRSSSISDDDGNIVVRFNQDGLAFFDPAGNLLLQVDSSGLRTFDADGDVRTRMGDLGATHGIEIADENGTQVFRVTDAGLLAPASEWVSEHAAAAISVTTTDPSYTTVGTFYATRIGGGGEDVSVAVDVNTNGDTGTIRLLDETGVGTIIASASVPDTGGAWSSIVLAGTLDGTSAGTGRVTVSVQGTVTAGTEVLVRLPRPLGIFG